MYKSATVRDTHFVSRKFHPSQDFLQSWSRTAPQDFVGLRDAGIATGDLRIVQELMNRRSAQVEAARLFGIVHADREADATEKAVNGVDAVAGGRDADVVGRDARVGELSLRFDVEAVEEAETPAHFTGQTVGHVVHRALLVTVDREVRIDLGDAADDVREHAVFGRPRAIERKAVGLHVAFAAGVVLIAVRVAERCADAGSNRLDS